LKFAKGNPKTGLAGSGDVSSGLSKKGSVKNYMPRGETQGQRPGPSSAGGGGSGKANAIRKNGVGQRPSGKSVY
jgi:hypothetical protein